MGFWSRLFSGKPQVFRQRKWSEAELVAAGFQRYESRKRVTMVRRLPKEESPKVIKTAWDTITATAGYFIAYQAGDKLHPSLDDYEPRPIEPHIFAETYAPWSEPGWKPTPAELHLMKLGCKPYYKTVGVWAKKLTEATSVQSLESAKPSIAPVGAWLCIGAAGEPWSVSDEWFHWRYASPAPKSKTGKLTKKVFTR
jgi:hypothetical protein